MTLVSKWIPAFAGMTKKGNIDAPLNIYPSFEKMKDGDINKCCLLNFLLTIES